MAFATVNGAAIFIGVIEIPRVGAWSADLSVDQTTAVTGACTIAITGGLTLVGTAHRTGVWQDTARLRVVGGADGLGKPAKPRHYRQTRLQVVLSDVLATAGEKLSPASSAAVLGLTFPHWATIGQSCGSMVAAMLGDDRLPTTTAWRVLADGTLWVGTETWPDSGLKNLDDYQDLYESPADGWLDLGVEAPSLLPGTLLGGSTVSYVEHTITGDSARTRAWVE
jgi:hypothetical protein